MSLMKNWTVQLFSRNFSPAAQEEQPAAEISPLKIRVADINKIIRRGANGMAMVRLFCCVIKFQGGSVGHIHDRCISE
jgi:hypothetical protein